MKIINMLIIIIIIIIITTIIISKSYIAHVSTKQGTQGTEYIYKLSERILRPNYLAPYIKGLQGATVKTLIGLEHQAFNYLFAFIPWVLLAGKQFATANSIFLFINYQ